MVVKYTKIEGDAAKALRALRKACPTFRTTTLYTDENMKQYKLDDIKEGFFYANVFTNYIAYRRKNLPQGDIDWEYVQPYDIRRESKSYMSDTPITDAVKDFFETNEDMMRDAEKMARTVLGTDSLEKCLKTFGDLAVTVIKAYTTKK